jgi:ABC-2 type transport system permease protein
MFPFAGMPGWAQAIGEVLPVTHFLRIIRGALLKGVGAGELWREHVALLAFVCVVTALAMARYRRTLD